MVKQDFSNLTDKILIASPFAMEGDVFNKSLIYIIRHSSEGSVGLIFNHPVSYPATSPLLKKITNNDININNLNLDIHLGGPVEVERGFFLHTGEYNKNLLFNLSDSNIAISSNSEILQDIADGTGPERKIFIIGYTAWEAGQLESELEKNLWLIAEPDHDLIFLEDSKEKWSKALSQLGITTSNFVETNLANS